MSRYCSGEYFWVMNIDNNRSGTWKTILKHRHKSLQCINRCIVNRRNTKIWFDPWINSGIMVKFLGWDHLSLFGGENLTVDYIVNNGVFNPNCLPAMRLLSSQINSVNINSNGNMDFWSWNNTKDGFTFYSAWDSSKNHDNEKDWCKIVRHAISSPKMSLCMYKAVLNQLSTKDIMVNRGYEINPICILCNEELETRDHLFFQCPYAAYPWVKCCLKLGLYPSNESAFNLEDEIALIRPSFTSASFRLDVASCAIATTVYHILNERNLRIHNNREWDKFHR